MLKTNRTLAVAALVAAASGCSTSMPTVRQSQPAPLPANASPTFAWSGERDDLRTYWGPQDVSVEVSAWIPEDWADPYDGAWRVAGRNAEGKPLPFLGVIRRYKNENGTELAEIVPPVDLRKVKDCLYFTIDPRIETRDGKVVAIRPMALVVEVRRHTFTPFVVKVPLVPREVTELTPAPEVFQKASGTAISVD